MDALAFSLLWRHNGRDDISNDQPRDCLFNCLFRRRSKKTSKLRATGLCGGNLPVTGEFPAQIGSTAEMLPFDDVTIYKENQSVTSNNGPVMWSFGVVLMFTWTRWWKTIQLPVIWGDMTLLWRHCNVQALAGRPWLLPSPGHHQQYY